MYSQEVADKARKFTKWLMESDVLVAIAAIGFAVVYILTR